MFEHAAELVLEGGDFLFGQCNAGQSGDMANVKIGATHKDLISITGASSRQEDALALC
jgi:hypothetical protein